MKEKKDSPTHIFLMRRVFVCHSYKQNWFKLWYFFLQTYQCWKHFLVLYSSMSHECVSDQGSVNFSKPIAMPWLFSVICSQWVSHDHYNNYYYYCYIFEWEFAYDLYMKNFFKTDKVKISLLISGWYSSM